MQEILSGVFHWSTYHEGIGERVHSYYLAAIEPAVLIDPRIPAEGLAFFRSRPRPEHIYLTNRHHYRHSDRFAEAFGTQIWCHEAGLHHFREEQGVRGFRHGDRLPGAVEAVEVGVLCPEETALRIPIGDGILAIGDAIIRDGDELCFVPDELMGDDPEGVKRGLRQIFTAHLQLPFDHLLFAHGKPWIGGAKAGLRAFLSNS